MANEVVKLDFTIASVTPTQVEFLIKNSGDALAQPLKIDVKIPLTLVPKQIAEAVNKAREDNFKEQTTTSIVSLANIVNGPAGWSVWAAAETTGADAVIRILNDLDQDRKKLAAPVKVEQNAQLSLRVPLLSQDKPAHVEITYVHRYPNVSRSGKEVSGKLQMTTAGAGAAPDVSFTVDHASPTTITPGDPVNISWDIENGVSATLYGPLPGGNSQMSLSSDDTAMYKINKGSLTIIAVGAATYTLHAEVRGAKNTNELVIKSIHIDVSSAKQYSYLAVRPSKALPHGMIEVNWAVWDCQQAWLEVGSNQIELQLTEQGPNQKYQGSGIWRVKAPQQSGDVSAWLDIRQKSGDRLRSISTSYKVATWDNSAFAFKGNPLGMAVAAPKLALLTTEGLWIAKVGFVDDSESQDLVFTPATVDMRPKTWLAVAAFENGFVVLQETNDFGLQLVRYTGEGKRDGLPVDLPATVRPLLLDYKTVCDLAVLRERVYVVIEGDAAPGPLRQAFSVIFKPQLQQRREPLLERFPRYRLIVFDNALYTINRDTGRMFRLRQTESGDLEQPVKAASAVKDGQSMIRRGLMVPVGRVLLVLGPSSVPSFDEIEGFGSLRYFLPKQVLESGPIKQDLVYNPQQDHWIPCGHGLDVEATSVAAFRPGASKRLWVANPDRKIKTLTGANEHLFAAEFEQDFSPKVLPPYLDANKKRQITIRNETGRAWLRMSEPYRKAGFQDFSAGGPAEVTQIPDRLENMSQATFEFTCNEADPVPMKLRFLTERPDGVFYDYMVEIIFSGEGLSSITSVFKRLTRWDQRLITAAEIQRTRVQHGRTNSITVQAPKPLTEGLTLNIRNLTSYSLVLKRPYLSSDRGKWSFDEPAPGAVNINWDTPAFVLHANGAGELQVEVDFALPSGIESPLVSDKQIAIVEQQKQRIRIVPDSANALTVLSTSFKAPNVYDCAIQYRLEKHLRYVSVAGGQGNFHGDALFLPVSSHISATLAQVLKIDANSLETTATSETFVGKELFSAPYGVGVCQVNVMAMFGDQNVHSMDHSLRRLNDYNLHDLTSNFRLITNIKAYNMDQQILFITIKERENQAIKYSYTYGSWYISKPSPTKEYFLGGFDQGLDEAPGFSTKKVAGAPAWVSASTISPVSPLLRGEQYAICIEGGVIIGRWNHSRSTLQSVRLEGTGREEAIFYDFNMPSRKSLVFCAHSHPNNEGLVISRINPENHQDRKTITLPGPVINIATDTRPSKTSALTYLHHRAVSMDVPDSSDALFVTHGKTIYHLDKNTLAVRDSATLDLPLRLLQVRLGKPPGTETPRYAGPQNCWMVWAVGATYTGDGTKVDQYKTKLYKVGFLTRH